MLKPPETRVRAGKRGLEDVLVTWSSGDGFARRYLRGEVSREINGTSNSGESWEFQCRQSRVVGNLVGTCDGGEEREGDVGKIGVGNKCNSTSSSSIRLGSDSGQVGCRDALEVVSVESEGTIDNSQRWDADGRSISESSVGSPDQVREADLERLTVGINLEQLGDVGNLSVEFLQTVVVVDVKSGDGLQVDTIEGAQESVGDEN